MRIKNVTEAQMFAALDAANQKYNGNLVFNRFDRNPKCIDFTLRVKSSKGPGHRVSYSRRRIPSACWHAHRDFMRAVFNIRPNAILRSCYAIYEGKSDFERKFRDTGERNIGSMIQPLYFDEACEC